MQRKLSAFVALATILALAADSYAVQYAFTNIADTATSAPVGTFVGFSHP